MAPIQSDCSPDTYGPKICPASRFTSLFCGQLNMRISFQLAQLVSSHSAHILYIVMTSWSTAFLGSSKFLIERVIINLVCSLTDVSFIMMVYAENALGATEELSLQYHEWPLGKTG